MNIYEFQSQNIIAAPIITHLTKENECYGKNKTAKKGTKGS